MLKKLIILRYTYNIGQIEPLFPYYRVNNKYLLIKSFVNIIILKKTQIIDLI